MPGIELVNMYSAGGMKMYISRAEGVHYYFAVKTGEGWNAAGEKYSSRHAIIAGEVAPQSPTPYTAKCAWTGG